MNYNSVANRVKSIAETLLNNVNLLLIVKNVNHDLPSG